MKNIPSAARSHIRNAVLCSLLTFGLVACGSESGSSSPDAASTVSDATPSVVTPSVGLIDRTSEADAPSVSSTTASNSTNNSKNGGSAGSSTDSSTGNPPKASTGVATLDWMPPTENDDGSVLTNLAGYTVYYGTSAGNLTQSVKITNPGLSAYTLSDLASGTWYFAMTSYSSTGVESTRSGVVSTSI
jgi:hypothetical protein